MANYRYKLYKGSRLDSESTTKAEAEKWAKRQRGEAYVIANDTGNIYMEADNGQWAWFVVSWGGRRKNPSNARRMRANPASLDFSPRSATLPYQRTRPLKSGTWAWSKDEYLPRDMGSRWDLVEGGLGGATATKASVSKYPGEDWTAEAWTSDGGTQDLGLFTRLDTAKQAAEMHWGRTDKVDYARSRGVYSNPWKNPHPPENWWWTMSSEEYGPEVFGPYDSYDDADDGITRVRKKVWALQDDIARWYSEPVSGPKPEAPFDTLGMDPFELEDDGRVPNPCGDRRMRGNPAYMSATTGQPHWGQTRNPDSSHPDYVQGFYHGIQAVADAAKYFGGRQKNPEPEHGHSEEYHAGWVAAVQLFGSHLISDTDAAWATVEALSGQSIPQSAPRPRRAGPGRPSAPRPATAPGGLTPLESQIYDTLPADGSAMPTSELKENWQANGLSVWVGVDKAAMTAGKTPKQVKSKSSNLFTAATRSLREKGLIEKVGKSRWSGFKRVAGAAVPTGPAAVPTAPRAPRAPRAPKPEAPAAAPTGPQWSDPLWLKAQAVMLANGASDALVQMKHTEALDILNKGQVPVLAITKMGDKLMVAAKPMKEGETLESLNNVLVNVGMALPVTDDTPLSVFALTATGNPYFGSGRGRFWGSWG